MNDTFAPRICGSTATRPASKVLSHGFESGQRTSGVGALLLEPAKCRCAVAPRRANGVRSGAAPARIADSRLHLRAPGRRVDVRPVLVQARGPGRTVGDPRRPRHRRGLRPRRRSAAPGGQPGQRAPHRRSGRQPDLRQGQRAGEIPAGPVGRHRRCAGQHAAAHGRQLRSGRSATAPRTTRAPLRWSPPSAARCRWGHGRCLWNRRRRCSPSTTTRPTSSGTASGPRSTCPTRRSAWRSGSTRMHRSR